jgi:hypothetical protein
VTLAARGMHPFGEKEIHDLGADGEWLLEHLKPGNARKRSASRAKTPAGDRDRLGELLRASVGRHRGGRRRRDARCERSRRVARCERSIGAAGGHRRGLHGGVLPPVARRCRAERRGDPAEQASGTVTIFVGAWDHSRQSVGQVWLRSETIGYTVYTEWEVWEPWHECCLEAHSGGKLQPTRRAPSRASSWGRFARSITRP